MVRQDNRILFRARKWTIKPWKDMGATQCILLSERSHCEKATYFKIPTRWHPGKGKSNETVKESVVAMCWGYGEG